MWRPRPAHPARLVTREARRFTGSPLTSWEHLLEEHHLRGGARRHQPRRHLRGPVRSSPLNQASLDHGRRTSGAAPVPALRGAALLILTRAALGAVRAVVSHRGGHAPKHPPVTKPLPVVTISAAPSALWGSLGKVELAGHHLTRNRGQPEMVTPRVRAQPRERRVEALVVALGHDALGMFDDHAAGQGVLELLGQEVFGALRADVLPDDGSSSSPRAGASLRSAGPGRDAGARPPPASALPTPASTGDLQPLSPRAPASRFRRRPSCEVETAV